MDGWLNGWMDGWMDGWIDISEVQWAEDTFLIILLFKNVVSHRDQSWSFLQILNSNTRNQKTPIQTHYCMPSFLNSRNYEFSTCKQRSRL